MAILNLTQHTATPEQIEEGVVEVESGHKVILTNLLTFDEIPDHTDLVLRARLLTAVVKQQYPLVKTVMIGGAPYLMSHLETALCSAGFDYVYAFSKRESVEEVQEDGSVRKVNVFRHIGFV